MPKFYFSTDPNEDERMERLYTPKYTIPINQVLGVRYAFALPGNKYICLGFGGIDGYAAIVFQGTIEEPDFVKALSPAERLAWYAKESKVGPRASFPKDVYYFTWIRRAVEAACRVYQDNWPRVWVWYMCLNMFHMSGRVGSDWGVPDTRFCEWMREKCEIFRLPGCENNPDLDYADEIFCAFMSVYYGMVAENSKANAVLGARVKLYGLYRILFTNDTVLQAAQCMTGRNARLVLTPQMDAAGLPQEAGPRCFVPLQGGCNSVDFRTHDFVVEWTRKCWRESQRRAISPADKESPM